MSEEVARWGCQACGAPSDLMDPQEGRAVCYEHASDEERAVIDSLHRMFGKAAPSERSQGDH